MHLLGVSWDIDAVFIRAGDMSNDASPMVRELLEDNVRVLNLAGDANFACNFMVGTYLLEGQASNLLI